MDRNTIKLKCLNMALTGDKSPEDVVKRATAYSDYVLNERQSELTKITTLPNFKQSEIIKDNPAFDEPPIE